METDLCYFDLPLPRPGEACFTSIAGSVGGIGGSE